jgi:hypothetical protein
MQLAIPYLNLSWTFFHDTHSIHSMSGRSSCFTNREKPFYCRAMKMCKWIFETLFIHKCWFLLRAFQGLSGDKPAWFSSLRQYLFSCAVKEENLTPASHICPQVHGNFCYSSTGFSSYDHLTITLTWATQCPWLSELSHPSPFPIAIWGDHGQESPPLCALTSL